MRRPTVLAAVAVGLVLAAGLGGAACRRKPEGCTVCDRDVCRGVAFRVEFVTGRSGQYCCPRCASQAVAERGGMGAVRSLEARDFSTGAPVDGQAAWYVEGSDFEHCRAAGAMRNAEGGAAVRMSDRCQPSLLAFRDRAAAQAFVAQHGGRLRSFADLGFGQPGPGRERR